MLQTINIKDKEKIAQIKERSKKNFELALMRVLPVINDIKTQGDKALFQYIKKYDSFEAQGF